MTVSTTRTTTTGTSGPPGDAAMTAHARRMYTAALARTESRGMHRRSDFPGTDPAQHHRLRVCGIDAIAVSPDPVREVVGA